MYNTEGDALTLPEEAAERHYGTPPLQPKESAIHSYLMWSKLSLITPPPPQPPDPALKNMLTHADFIDFGLRASISQGKSPSIALPSLNQKKKKKRDITSSEHIILKKNFFFFFACVKLVFTGN